jgi:hypothetical protein
MYDKMRATPLGGPVSFAKAPSVVASLIAPHGTPAAGLTAPPLLAGGRRPRGANPPEGKREPAPKKEKKDSIDPYFRALAKTLTDISDLEELTAKLKEKGEDSTSSWLKSSGPCLWTAFDIRLRYVWSVSSACCDCREGGGSDAVHRDTPQHRGHEVGVRRAKHL